MKMIYVAGLAAALAVPAVNASAQGVTDPQIASIVVTANQVDIDAGKLAAARGTNPEVKKFGEPDGRRPHRCEQVGGRTGHEAEGHAGRQRDQQEL